MPTQQRLGALLTLLGNGIIKRMFAVNAGRR
jgi:hypothetical protein